MSHKLNRVKVKLPYPVRVGLFYIDLKKNVGFSFDNMAVFLLKENLGLKDSSELKQWIEKKSANELMIEQLFAAHQSFCLWEKESSISKKRFMDGISKITKEELQKIIKVWEHSETFGVKNIPGKKKAVRN
jgi:hypothetical protein